MAYTDLQSTQTGISKISEVGLTCQNLTEDNTKLWSVREMLSEAMPLNFWLLFLFPQFFHLKSEDLLLLPGWPNGPM